MNIASIGIDLGKNTFHLVALGEGNKIAVRKKFSRPQLLAYITRIFLHRSSALKPVRERISWESRYDNKGTKCGSSRPNSSNPIASPTKNDFLDAEAIVEAVTKENMRFVQIKTEEQLEVQAMHRVRDRLVQRRTAP